MDDLFADEQRVLDDALLYVSELKSGAAFVPERYFELVTEYRRILKLLRRNTKMADRSAINLFESNLDLTDKVHFDALTGIFNRRYMEDSLSRIVNTLNRSGGGLLSVMMIDIDFFKKYNDFYGHSQGDICLRSVATALSSAVTRTDDFVARYGGEEFIVVMPNTDKDGAVFLADKMLNAVRACNIPHEKNEAADCVTISVGATSGVVVSSLSGIDFVKRADEALYMSKQNGRNRFTHISFEEV